MKKSIFIAAIAERTGDGDLNNCIIHAESEHALVDMVNKFFETEKAEGHPVCEEDGKMPLRFNNLDEINGLNTMDIFGDREYTLVAAKFEL